MSPGEDIRAVHTGNVVVFCQILAETVGRFG